MQNHDSRLKIHTTVQPEEKQMPGQVVWESVPHPENEAKKRQRREKMRAGLTIGEKLIRNTAIAGALLMCVLAVRNVDQPWSTQALSGLKSAMTMRVDWDETIGRLSFVRALVPETALVFLNLSDGRDYVTPVQGTVTHGYSDQQPWLEYACAPSADVVASASGRVTAAAEGLGGEWIVLIEHEDSVETVYGYLADTRVQTGQTVDAGEVIGHAAGGEQARIYFEMRQSDQTTDPTGRLK